MNCKQYQQQAIDVAFGEAERTSEFDRHLESCQACRAEFAAYAFAAKGIEDAPVPPAPSLSNERLYSAIRAQNIRRDRSWLPRLAFAGAAASVALAVWMGFNRPTSDRQQPYVASTSETQDAAPRGPIIIPEPTPKIESSLKTQLAPAPPRADSRKTITPRPRNRTSAPPIIEEIPKELLAVVVGGAEGALDFEPVGAAFSRGGPATMETAPDTPSPSSDSPIVVIQPQGQATEKSSDDVSIGG